MSAENLIPSAALQAFEPARAADVKAQTEALRLHLMQEADVQRVVALEPLEPFSDDQRWVYLVETPFMTFPNFAVGTTNAANNDVRILVTGGAEWAAIERFNTALAQGGVL